MVNLKPDLKWTAACVAVERLGTTLTPAEEAHVRTCARCEAEFSLWQSFNESQPAGDEGAAVQWIVSELKRRRAPAALTATALTRRGWFAWRPLAGLAALMLVASTIVLLRNPEPDLGQATIGTQRYRAETIKVVAPGGDLAAAPTALSWVAVEGAVEYDVNVLEIDQVPLWSTSSRIAQVELPRALVTRFVPGKTLLWSVTARDKAGRPFAESGFQRFRVVVAGGSGRH